MATAKRLNGGGKNETKGNPKINKQKVHRQHTTWIEELLLIQLLAHAHDSQRSKLANTKDRNIYKANKAFFPSFH